MIEQSIPDRTPCESLLSAIHAALGVPHSQLYSMVPLVRSVIATALGSRDTDWQHLVHMLDQETEHTGGEQQ